MFGSIISGIGSALGLYKTYKDIEGEGGSGGSNIIPIGPVWDSFNSYIESSGYTWDELKSDYDEQKAVAVWVNYYYPKLGRYQQGFPEHKTARQKYPNMTLHTLVNGQTGNENFGGAIDTASGQVENADGFINWNSNNSGTNMTSMVFFGVLAWGLTKVVKELF